MMKHIITIQHTQSVQHTNGKVGSWADWDLTDLGLAQAKRMGEKLACELKDEEYVMYSSDLLRAKRTAESVAGFLGIEPRLDERLREFNFGEACGQTKQWAKENGRAAADPFCRSIDERPFASAETMREVRNRLDRFYSEIMSKADHHIIIVSHSGTLGMFYSLWLGLGIETFFQYELRSNAGGVSFLRENDDGKHVISRLNDRSYIQ